MKLLLIFILSKCLLFLKICLLKKSLSVDYT